MAWLKVSRVADEYDISYSTAKRICKLIREKGSYGKDWIIVYGMIRYNEKTLKDLKKVREL